MAPFHLVFQAGIGNSEPEHWQSLWARSLPGSTWVEQEDWDHAPREAWVATLERTLLAAPRPSVVIAHSLGCLAVAEAAGALVSASVAGAFLVAVPDVSGSSFPAGATGWRPAASLRMPVPSLVVASSDDPYGSPDHARRAARAWGSELVPVGARGHVNVRSGLGAWEEGRALLDRFLASLPRP